MVFDLLFITALIVGVCVFPVFCSAVLCVLTSFSIIFIGKRGLVVLLCLSTWCFVL